MQTTGEAVVVWDIHGDDIPCDVSDPGSVDAALAQTIEEHGVPTRRVACAGIGASGTLLQQTRWVTGQTVLADGGLAQHSPVDAFGQVQRLTRG